MPATDAFTIPRPGDIEFLPLQFMLSSGGGESWDIRHLVREFNLYESLDQDHLRLDLVMEDSLSLMARMPIIGEETLSLAFKTPSEAPDSYNYRTIVLSMQIVNCQKLQYTNTRSEAFKLEFVSGSRIQNQKAIVQDLLQGPISGMISQVGQTYLGLSSGGGGQDSLTVDPTIGNHSFVIPSLSPFETIHFLAGEAQAADLGSNYLFFHGCEGAKFTTSETLLGGPVAKPGLHDEEGGTYYVTEHSLFKNPVDAGSRLERDISNDVSDGISAVGDVLAGFTNPAEWRFIFDFTVEQLFDVEPNLSQGTYDNQVSTIDPILQQFENVKTLGGEEYFDYLNTFPAFKSNGPAPIISQNSPVAGGSGLSSKRYLITNKNQGLDLNFAVLPRLRQDFLPYCSSMLGQLNTVVAHMTIPGDSNRTVGDNIILDLHEIGATDDIQGELHEYLSGKWTVAACRHKYTAGQGGSYTTILKIIKNGLASLINTETPPRTF